MIVRIIGRNYIGFEGPDKLSDIKSFNLLPTWNWIVKHLNQNLSLVIKVRIKLESNTIIR